MRIIGVDKKEKRLNRKVGATEILLPYETLLTFISSCESPTKAWYHNGKVDPIERNCGMISAFLYRVHYLFNFNICI